MNSIQQEARDRIINAANMLYDEAGRGQFPTVDAVRRASKADMNATSVVMKEWRRMQATTAVVVVPERLQQTSQAFLAALWIEAQEITNQGLLAAQQAWDAERAVADTVHAEVAAACDAAQSRVLALEAVITALDGQLSAAAMRAITTEARIGEIERQAADLKGASEAAQESAKASATELAGILSELATAQAQARAAQDRCAEYRQRVVDEACRSADRLALLEADLDASRKESVAAKESTANLRGQLDATLRQNVAILTVFKDVATPLDSGKTRE